MSKSVISPSWVRIGAQAMVGGMTGVEKDVIPFGMVIGNRAWLQGLNIIGLKRRGYDRPTIHALRSAYRDIFEGEGSLVARAEAAAEAYPDVEPVQTMIDFITEDSSRSFCTPRAD